MTPLLAQLQSLLSPAETGLWPAVLIFLRTGAMMSLMPAFGETVVPQRMRLILALAFTVAVAPAVWADIPASAGATALLVEVAVGLILGAGLRFFVLCLQLAGTMIAQSTSLAQVFGGVSEPQPAIGQLLVMAGLTVAVLAGLPVHIVEMLITSYKVIPPGQMPSAADAASWGVAGVSRMFRLALQIAAPFVATSLLYNIALGFMNRAIPALMVSFIGAPVLSLGGLALLAILIPMALPIWWQALHGFLAAPFAVTP